jgi:hypothetical protein
MRATKIILSPYGGGRGVWAEHLRWAAPESVALFLGAFTCVYRSGWARRAPPLSQDTGIHFSSSRIFPKVPSQCASVTTAAPPLP